MPKGINHGGARISHSQSKRRKDFSQVQPHPRFRTTHSSKEQGISHQRQGHESRVSTLTFSSSISEAVSRAAVSILKNWYLLCCRQRRLSGRRPTMIHRCKSLFSSACLCEGTAPLSLPQHHHFGFSQNICSEKAHCLASVHFGLPGDFPILPRVQGWSCFTIFSVLTRQRGWLQTDPFGSKTRWSRITTFRMLDGGRCGRYYFVSVLWLFPNTACYFQIHPHLVLRSQLRFVHVKVPLCLSVLCEQLQRLCLDTLPARWLQLIFDILIGAW